MSLESLYSGFENFVEKNPKLVSVIKYTVLGIFLVYPAYLIYNRYTLNKERKAQHYFAESYAEYDKALKTDLKGVGGKNSGLVWNEACSHFQLSREKHSSTELSIYMAVFEAQCLARLGKVAEAKSLLKKNLAKLDYSPYQNVYKTFEALLLIDYGDTSAGYQQLKKLAFDVDNPSQDMALYYLGTYELSQGNKDSAINNFNMIFNIRHINQVMSPWQELALQQLGELE
jgi:predicted Zn-dependent protease